MKKKNSPMNIYICSMFVGTNSTIGSRAALFRRFFVMSIFGLLTAHGASGSPAPTTAWGDGKFQVDVASVVQNSNIVLGQPNVGPTNAMPLGNGNLGAAVWIDSSGNLTTQLNRADTLPGRLSPGWVTIPLNTLTQASDYKGVLNLYDGELVQSGGGITAITYVDSDQDRLVFDITGANPGVAQTVHLTLWAHSPTSAYLFNAVSSRHPTAYVWGQTNAALAETWIDATPADAPGANDLATNDIGGSHQTFGSLAGVTVEGNDVQASIDAPNSQGDTGVTVTFKPRSDGSFRILVACPQWRGGSVQEVETALREALAPSSVNLANSHRVHWHNFWNQVGLIHLNSSDGVAEYMENLRLINLYAAAGETGTDHPGSQAGIADLYLSAQDNVRWDPAAFWHWNLRMQVAANLGAGLPELNQSFFNLYCGNLTNLEAWTHAHMANQSGPLPGIGVPETMRYNGNGWALGWTFYDPSGWTDYLTNPAHMINGCDSSALPGYNSRTLTTGAEVSLWIWQQFLATDDYQFLANNYPFMRQSALFLLAYAGTGTDGLLHTYPSNAHETQWDVHDPTTDIAAMSALFPAVIQSATLLGKDPDVVSELKAALSKLLQFPRTDIATQSRLLPPSEDASGQDIIGPSYDPSATMHNGENIGLEPVWPYNVIGDTSPLFSLAIRTYYNRPNTYAADWSFDPIQAARLQLGNEVKQTLLTVTGKYQKYPNGFAQGADQYDFYIEQSGVVADALQEAFVQDYDGVVRIAPACPPDWNGAATVFVQHNTKVDVQVVNGTPVTVAIETGFTGTIRVRNPWPNNSVQVVSGLDPSTKIPAKLDSSNTLTFSVVKGQSYLIETASNSSLPFQPITSSPATSYKTLSTSSGTVTIGLPSVSQ
jgi:alpha-L-fucosidase 2